jgi:hypothetical protein
VDGETAVTVEAWPVTFIGWEATGVMAAVGEEAGLSLLRMLAIVKEVGVDLPVGEVLGLGGCGGATKVFSISVFGCRAWDDATTAAGRAKEGIWTCKVRGFCCCCCEVGKAGKLQGRVRAGRPTPGRPGRCMHDGYTDIIMKATTGVL